MYEPSSPIASSPSTAQAPAAGWHSWPLKRVIEQFHVDPQQGLTDAEAAARRARIGPNELSAAPAIPLWKKLISQFQDLVVWILIIAAVISGLLGEWADTVAILAIVLVNGLIGFFQEERAGQALAALRKISAPTAKVLRNGVVSVIPARDLAPGDRLEIEAGDNIPADCRLWQAFQLAVQESPLTGESVPVDKRVTDDLDEAAPLGDRRNMIFAGTAATAGKASAIVVGTGMQTELGRIAGLLEQVAPEQTPLQRRLAELGKILAVACLVICALIFLIQLARGRAGLDTLLISISLAVAAVPEGLPAVVTLALALGLQRMVKRHVLIRKLPSVETLGSVTVICSDKTGTLTRNEMTVREIVTADARYHLSGAGYAPQGDFHKTTLDAPEKSPVDAAAEADLMQLLTIAAQASHATLHGPDDDGNWKVIGDPTEGALVAAAKKAGFSWEELSESLVHEIPFDADRRTMSVVVRDVDDQLVMYTKGAPESVLPNCLSEYRGGQCVPLAETRRRELMEINTELAGRALRVLAFAYRELTPDSSADYQEADLVFVGLAGMIDPPRDEVKSAVLTCRSAGIRPVMITGDHPQTALAIARELKLFGESGRVVTGAELDRLDDAELAAQIDQISVYARVAPEHKLRVVRAWKSRGEIVAMTGDGVNDAPAVDAADIGIAMGITGTDVTKQASDMVLTDDNFTSIVSAVEEGRGIFDNIQKVIHYLLSCNAGEVLLMVFAAVIGWPIPLLAVQILWINLVTDGLPALALTLESPEPDIMTRPPRTPRRPVLNWQSGLSMVAHGALIAAVAAVGFWYVYHAESENLPRARMVAFCVTAFAQLFFALGCRSRRYILPQLGFLSNPQLIGALIVSGLLQLAVIFLPFAQSVFDTNHRLTWEWLLILSLALVPLSLIEFIKWIRFAGRDTSPAESSDAG
ncbi:MAG: cation-translocating P-type ATPase [Planctomycetaceae bacterium]